MRIWFDTNRPDQLSLSPGDIIDAIQAQNVVAPIGRIGARPAANDVQFQFNLQTQGPPGHRRPVRRDRAARQSGRLDPADQGRWPGWNSARRTRDSESRLDGQPSVAVGIYLAPGANDGEHRRRREPAS